MLYTMVFGKYPNDEIELDKFKEIGHYSIKTPVHPVVSDECKLLIKNILVDEENRFTLDMIMNSDWFKKEWQPVATCHELKSYFENLNVPRTMTESFETTGNMSNADEYTSSVALSYTSSQDSNSGDDHNSNISHT